MRPISVALSREEFRTLVEVLAYALQTVPPQDYYRKLLYLHASKLYTRLFTKLAFVRPNQKVGFRPEEACAFCLLFAHELSGRLPDDSFEAAVVQKLLLAFDRHLS